MFAVDESRPRIALLERDRLAHEERVVADGMFGPNTALDPRERVGEERRAGHTVPRGHALPERDRRHAAGEAGRDVLLVAAEDRHSERARRPQQLVERESASDRDADERWRERERDE